MPSVDGQLAAWLKSEALYALSLTGGVAWGASQSVNAEFMTPYDARADGIAEGARTTAILGGPNVKERVLVKGRRRDLLFKCIQLEHSRLGYGSSNQPELVTNGDGSSAVGWSLAGGSGSISSVSGRLRVSCTTTNVVFRQAIPVVNGRRYQIKFDQFNGTGLGQVVVGSDIGLSDLYNNQTVNGAGQSGTFLATSTTADLQIYDYNSGTFTEYDNVSLKPTGPLVFVIGVQENDNNTTTLTVIRRLS
jgi:hypothetical protein